MPYFSKRSQERLATCDSHLQALFNEIIRKSEKMKIHKRKRRDALLPYWYQTYCGVLVSKYKSSNHWNKVTCENCKKGRGK